MSFVKIWIHAIWSTKSREPLLSKNLRLKVFPHIVANAKTKDIYVDCINGYIDHVHCLLSLNPDQAISYILQLIKGERSFWVNKNHLCSAPFQWQDEHFALAVSESNLGAVRNYIRNQEQHHQQKSFEQECRELLSKNGFTAKQLHHGVVVSEISR